MKLLLALAPTPAQVIKYPDFIRELVVHTDASEAGVGAFLPERSRESISDSDLDTTAYCSHGVLKTQRHYSSTMKECCAVVWAATHWRPYLWGKHFTCCTGHQALTYLYKMQDISNVLTRRAIALQNYDSTVKHVPGKLNVVPDMLSRAFVDVVKEPIPCEPSLAAICLGPASTNSLLINCTM